MVLVVPTLDSGGDGRKGTEESRVCRTSPRLPPAPSGPLPRTVGRGPRRHTLEEGSRSGEGSRTYLVDGGGVVRCNRPRHVSTPLAPSLPFVEMTGVTDGPANVVTSHWLTEPNGSGPPRTLSHSESHSLGPYRVEDNRCHGFRCGRHRLFLGCSRCTHRRLQGHRFNFTFLYPL